MVGHTAPDDFIQQISDMAHEHHEVITVDCIRSYHFGARYNVEIEVVMPGRMTVAESRYCAGSATQDRGLVGSDVERAFVHVHVHVDHAVRDGLE